MLTGEHVPGKPCGRQGFAGGTWPEDVVPKQTGRTARGRGPGNGKKLGRKN
jgi:hypothetical protein